MILNPDQCINKQTLNFRHVALIELFLHHNPEIIPGSYQMLIQSKKLFHSPLYIITMNRVINLFIYRNGETVIRKIIP